MRPKAVVKRLQAHLSPDLLHRKFRHLAADHPHAGHCYVATEALYHALGGPSSGYRPVNIHWEGGPHWFLQHATTGQVLDPTVGQFETPVPYHKGTRKGFLTKQPSRRAQELLRRAKLSEAWHRPLWAKEHGEFERVSHEEGIPLPKLRQAFDKAQLGPTHPHHLSTLQNTDVRNHSTVDAVHQMAKGYGRDSHEIERGLRTGASLPAPIILHRPGQDPTLVAGNTRLCMAKVMGHEAHALHVKLDEAKDPHESRVDTLIKQALRG